MVFNAREIIYLFRLLTPFSYVEVAFTIFLILKDDLILIFQEVMLLIVLIWYFPLHWYCDNRCDIFKYKKETKHWIIIIWINLFILLLYTIFIKKVQTLSGSSFLPVIPVKWNLTFLCLVAFLLYFLFLPLSSHLSIFSFYPACFLAPL